MKLTTIFTLALTLGLATAAIAADAPTCQVCNMKVDAKHNLQFRYVLASGKHVAIGSMTCAESYWRDHKADKLVFEVTDFASGKWTKADDGHFLVGSKLKLGTGMDKTTVVFFADRGMADKARAANGGKVVRLAEALKVASNHGAHHHGHAH